MRQLGGLDASFLYMETPQTPMHVGGLYLFELPEGYQGDFYDDFKAHIARRMHLAPILSQKLSPMPLEMDHPVWIDAGKVDLDYHIRRSGLPRPGTMQQLEDLVGRLHSNFLDRTRPLWEFTIIDGLQTGQAALYTKMHHAAIDGGAGMQLTRAIYDLTPTPREVDPPAQPARAEPSPNLLTLLGTAYASYLRQQVRSLQAIPDAWKAFAKAVLPDAQTLRYQPFSPPPLVAPHTILNGTITNQRVFAARMVPLDDAKRVAKATGAKLNDVVLAACAGALRRYLKERDALPDQPLTAFVPVSLREAGNTEANNQVFGMVCSLATNLDDPLARLRAIVESSGQAKQLTGNIKDVVPRDYSILGAPLLLQGLMGLYGRSGLADQMQLAANVTVSNVPGPPTPLYAAGARMLTMYPVSIPTHGVALNITVQSYDGALDFGLTTCRNLLPDVRVLADHIVEAMAELKEAVGQSRAPRIAAADAPAGDRTESGEAARSAVGLALNAGRSGAGATLAVDGAPLAGSTAEAAAATMGSTVAAVDPATMAMDSAMAALDSLSVAVGAASTASSADDAETDTAGPAPRTRKPTAARRSVAAQPTQTAAAEGNERAAKPSGRSRKPASSPEPPAAPDTAGKARSTAGAKAASRADKAAGARKAAASAKTATGSRKLKAAASKTAAGGRQPAPGAKAAAGRTTAAPRKPAAKKASSRAGRART